MSNFLAQILSTILSPEGVTRDNWKVRLLYSIPITLFLAMAAGAPTVISKVIDVYGKASTENIAMKDQVIKSKQEQIAQLKKNVEVFRDALETSELLASVARDELKRHRKRVYELERQIKQEQVRNETLERALEETRRALTMAEQRIKDLELVYVKTAKNLK